MNHQLICKNQLSPAQLKSLLNYDSSLSPRSQELYFGSISRFFKWLDDNGIQPENISVFTISQYMDFLRTGGAKNTYININIKAIKKFYKLLKKTDSSIINPTDEIKYYKEDPCTSKYKWLSTEQLQQISRIIKKGDDEKSLRDYAIFVTLLKCGLRASELINLKFSDIMYADGKAVEFKVFGKGEKTRYVEIDDSIMGPINEYNKIAGALTNADDYIFKTTPTNARPHRGQMSYHALYFLTRTWGKKIGIEKKKNEGAWIRPHLFRHSFASHALKNGADLLSISHRLGHSSINLTAQIYVHQDDHCLQYLKFNFI